MSRDAQEAGAAARTSCPLCGRYIFSWGVMRGHPVFPLKFMGDDAGVLTKLVSGGQGIKARRCDSCGNIQLFAVE